MTFDLKRMLTPTDETFIKKTSTCSQHFLNPSGLYMHVPLTKSQATPKPPPDSKTQAMLTISPANFNNKITELISKENIISRNNKFKKVSQKPKPKNFEFMMGAVRSMKNIRFRSQGDIGGSRDLLSERKVRLGDS
jgi:hypothetical protein